MQVFKFKWVNKYKAVMCKSITAFLFPVLLHTNDIEK
jgi:hypothetical protein